MTEKLLLTLNEAADALSLSERTIRYLITRGELAPVVHIGRSVRIPMSSLRALVEQRMAAMAGAEVERSVGRSSRVG